VNYFGFLDPDIFPIRSTSIIEPLENFPFYGPIGGDSKKWMIWPGFCFFRTEFMVDKKVNFLPGKQSDTGGRNWGPIYSKFKMEDVPVVPHEHGYFGEKNNSDSWYNRYDIYGDWIHTGNSSNWRKAKARDQLIQTLLEKY
jgi:hypothetical protein